MQRKFEDKALLHSMLIYATVIEAGGFTKAADRLGMSKSSISKHISALEKYLGVVLLRRSTRQLSITEEGHTFYQHCASLDKLVETALQSASQSQTQPVGTLRITAPPAFGQLCLAAILPGFQKCYPLVKVQLALSQPNDDIIAEGYDIALRMGELRNTTLVAQQFYVSKRVLCASPGYLKQKGFPEKPDALTDYDCAVWQLVDRPVANEWHFKKRGKTSVIKVPVCFSCNDISSLKKFVMSSGGIAVLPKFAVQEELKEGTLLPILNSYDMGSVSLNMVYAQRHNMPAKTKVFIEYVKKQFAS